MKKPFVKGGKALTLAAALLCGAAFLGSFTALAAQAESQTGAQAEARYSRREWQARLPPVRFQEINRTLRLDFPAAGM